MQKPTNRRAFIRTAALGLAAPTHLLRDAAPLSIVCVGGHPDDPESGCGGTLARYAQAGHHVTIVYLTRGEAGIAGKTHSEAAAIRTAEAEQACKTLQARPVFFGQIDGDTQVSGEHFERMDQLLNSLQPDIVLTHWPLDSHADHRAASQLTLNTWFTSNQRFQLYFFEVMSGSQTVGFYPTDYVDISATLDKKKAALFAHRSQQAEAFYQSDHAPMERFRGMEAGVKAAEAFVHLSAQKQRSRLPGI